MGKGKGQVAPRGCWGGCDCPKPGYVALSTPGDLNLIRADPANIALEAAYKAAYPYNAVLTNMDLDKGNLGTMPGRGGLTSRERAFFQEDFLPQFKGIRNRRRPDIMDFSSKLMYEIKTKSGREDGLHQLMEDYRVANMICQDGDTDIRFHRYLARWELSHIYPFPGNPHIYICCGLTNYNATQQVPGRTGMQTEDESGLIIYRLFIREDKFKDEEEKARVLRDGRNDSSNTKKRKKKVRAPMNERIPEIPREVWIRMEQEMDRTLGERDEGEEFVIIAPKAFYHQFVEVPRMNRQIEMLQVHGADARTNPVMAFRSLNIALGAVIAGTALAIGLIVVVGYAAAFAAAAAEAAAAASVATAAEAAVGAALTTEIVFINAARIVAANDNAQKIVKAAAAVLLIVATVRDAQAGIPVVEEVDAVMAVPASQFAAGAGDTGTYNGKTYYRIANAYASGG